MKTPDKPVGANEIRSMSAKQKLALLKKIAPNLRRPRLRKRRVKIVINIKAEP